MTTPPANFIGLAQIIYNDPLPTGGSVQVNEVKYTVVASLNDSSTNYQGLVLFDEASNSLVVVDRGTDGLYDGLIDAKMAITNINDQWPDALQLAQIAEQYASDHGISSIYTVGHSLGGSLAQMQAAYFGWTGYTFNPYGAYDVFTQLGYAINQNARIYNYRTLFDVVSDSSTHIGDLPVTIQTPQDLALLSSGNYSNPIDLAQTILSDHFIKNFYSANSDPSGTTHDGAGFFEPSTAFSLTPPSNREVAMAEALVAGVAQILDLSLLHGLPVGDLSVEQSAAQAWQLLTNQSVSGVRAVVPANSSLLGYALDPAISNNIYRASLAATSPVVLQGLDPSVVQSYSLWTPGQTSGLTKEYIVARNDMVQAMIKFAGSGQLGGVITTSGANSFEYVDLARSPSPLYTLTGNGGSSYSIVFADDNGDGLTVAPGAYAELFGGAGNDILFGGTVGSTLQGGAGNDDYIIDGSGKGTDYILDTDGQGYIEWKFADGSTQTLTGGDRQEGTSYWTSADGLVTYFEGISTDGSTKLGITSGNKTVYVDDFTNGEFGITLNTTPASTPTNALQITADNSFSPGILAATEYDDNTGATVLLGPTDTSGQVWAIDGLGEASSIYGGIGNELILADHRALGSNGVVNTNPVYIQAGSGMQAIVGGQGKDTLVGGSDTLTAVMVDFDAGTGPLAGSQAGAYTMVGVTGFDWITGGGGDALIMAGPGAALIEGGSGADTIIGGAGNDTIFAGLSNYSDGLGDEAIINLYDSNGVLSDIWLNGIGGSSFAGAPTGGTPSANLIFAGDGDDLIFGGLGDDTIYGGSGHDTIVGNNGNKTIYGGTGNSVIYAADNETLARLDGVAWSDSGASYSDTIYGGGGNTTIYGSGGNNYLYADDGDVLINVGNGNSVVYGGAGNDTINGGNGDEIIYAGEGKGLIHVGDGDTYVNAGLGDSTIYGGAGSDTIEADGGTSQFFAGAGPVTYVIGTNTGSGTIEPGTGAITVFLEGGLTESDLVVRHNNGDLVLTDPDSDTELTIKGYFTNNANVVLSFQDGTVWGGSEILSASISPSNGRNDTLVGSNGNDSITAGIGDTLILDAAGNNTLIGGAGSDTIYGGGGSDTIEGGSGATQIFGGSGLETYVFNPGDGSSTITGSSGGSGNDIFRFGAGIALSDITFAQFGADGLLMTVPGIDGGSTSSVLIRHYLSAGAGAHTVGQVDFSDGTSLDKSAVVSFIKTFYGDGTDGETVSSTVAAATYYAGGGNNVTVIGGQGDDLIYGGAHSDVLEGAGGDDTLIGGYGGDLIETGEGSNLVNLVGDFVVDTVIGGSGNDTISVQGASEQISGGGGANTFVIDPLYLFGAPDGTLPNIVINDASAADTLQLLHVTSLDQLVVTQIDSNLRVTVNDQLDITLNGITSGSDTPALVLADGSVVPGTNVFALASNDSAPIVNGQPQAVAATAGLNFEWALPSGLFTDPDPSDSLTFGAWLVDGAGHLQALPSWLQFDGASGSFSGIPSATDVGTHLAIRITATDSYGAQAETEFDVSIMADRAPTATGVQPDYTLAGGQQFAFTLDQVQFADVDVGDALSYQATMLDANNNVVAIPDWLEFNPSTVSFSGTVPTVVDSSGYKIGVIATDLQGKSVTSYFNINLTGIDIPPRQSADWSDNIFDTQNDTLSLNVDSWVSGEGALSWSATLLDGAQLPPWLSFDPVTRIFSGHLTQASVGDTPIELTVTDQAGATYTGSFVLHVQDVPDSPIVTMPLADVNVSIGQNVLWSMPAGLFSDQDTGDQSALSYTVTAAPDIADAPPPAVWALPGWLSYDEVNNTLSGTVPSDAIGPYSVSITATDPTGLSATTVFKINITNSNVSYVNGTLGNDKLRGSKSAPSVIDGGDGNDNLTGGAAGNWLLGGAGLDTLTGGASSDFLAGGAGNDSLVGGDGRDTLYGGEGADTLVGGAGTDILRSDRSDTIVHASGDGSDELEALGTLSLTSSGLTITKAVADYSLPYNDGTGFGWRLTLSNGETIAIHDYDRPTILAYDNAPLNGDAVTLQYAGTTQLQDMSYYFTNRYSGFESDGSSGNDSIRGQSVKIQQYQDSYYYDYYSTRDTIYAGDGNDTVASGQDADSVDGGNGDDLLSGGLGTDTLIGGAGNDTLDGDGGWNESFVQGQVNSAVNPGNDSLVGGDGNDTYYESSLPDYYNYSGGYSIGRDTITDSSGDDTIVFDQYDDVTEQNISVSGNTMFISDGYGRVSFDITQIETVVLSDGSSITPSEWTAQPQATASISSNVAGGASFRPLRRSGFEDAQQSSYRSDWLSSEDTNEGRVFVRLGQKTLVRDSNPVGDSTPLEAGGRAFERQWLHAPIPKGRLDTSAPKISAKHGATMVSGYRGIPGSAHANDQSTPQLPDLANHPDSSVPSLEENRSGFELARPPSAPIQHPSEAQRQGLARIFRPSEERRRKRGAPSDPLRTDSSDPESLSSWSRDDSAARGEPMARGSSVAAPSGRSQVRAASNTSDIAGGMIKALVAAGGLSHPGSHGDFGDEVFLQGGVRWSVSALDRVLAGEGEVVPHATNGVNRIEPGHLAYARLVEAIGAFNPEVSAESSVLPNASEAYAIALAVQH